MKRLSCRVVGSVEGNDKLQWSTQGQASEETGANTTPEPEKAKGEETLPGTSQQKLYPQVEKLPELWQGLQR